MSIEPTPNPVGEAAAPTTAAQPARRSGSRTGVVVVVLSLLLVGGLLFLAQQQWRIFSPDRVGSTHRVTVTYNECLNDRPLKIADGDWSATSPWPTTWPARPTGEREGSVTVPGTLHITSKDRGTFTADQGGSVEMVRSPAAEFYHPSCAIQPRRTGG